MHAVELVRRPCFVNILKGWIRLVYLCSCSPRSNILERKADIKLFGNKERIQARTLLDKECCVSIFWKYSLKPISVFNSWSDLRGKGKLRHHVVARHHAKKK